MKDLVIRASQVSNLLTSDRSGKAMGETAKTLIKTIAIENLYGKVPSFESKYTDKGTMLEQDAIEMLNRNLFTDYVKNTVRIHTDKFTGECDIHDKGKIIRDIKCSWSVSTFPWTIEDAEKEIKKSGYEEQGRTYMMLYNEPRFAVDFCLLSTPIDLLSPFDDFDFHDVDDIPEIKRITTVYFERDLNWEAQLLHRWEQANEYYINFVNQILNK
jgi:hypothetical protein